MHGKTAHKKIKELRKAIKKYKKNGEVNMVIRLMVLIAYLSKKPVDKIAIYFDISEKTVRRWIKEYENDAH